MAELAVVVTIYNAEKTIPELISRLQQSAATVTIDYELIFIEDRSRDNSWKVLKEASKADKRIKVARMARNFGQHSALTAGLKLANGNAVVLMDGDLQDEPEEIPKLFALLKSTENEIIYARRMRRKDSWFKKITSRIFYKIFSAISGVKTDSTIGTFRIMTRLVCESYNDFKEVNKYVGGIFSWMDFESGAMDVEHRVRKEGRSNYNISRMIRLAKNGIVSFSNKPLNLAIYFGFISSISSFALGIYFIIRKIFLNVSLTGWSSLIVSVYFIGGIILLVLGIL